LGICRPIAVIIWAFAGVTGEIFWNGVGGSKIWDELAKEVTVVSGISSRKQ